MTGSLAGVLAGVVSLAAVSVAAFPVPVQPPAAEAAPRLLRAGDPAGALKLIDEALVQGPPDARLLTLRGLALTRLDREEDGLAAYRQALAIAPEYLPALQGAAQVEYRTRSPEAQQTLERILRVDAGNAVAHAMLGALAYEAQDCPTALGHFREADAAIRGNPQALWQTAHCLFVDGSATDAAGMFERLLRTGGLNARQADLVAFNLALSLHTAGRHARAIATLEPLAGREIPDRDVLALLGDAYAASLQVEEAVATLRRATTIYPRDEQFYVALGALCLETDSFALGREIVEVGLQNVPGSARLYALRGVIHAQLGSFDDAQADFERVARMEPQQPAAVAGLSLTLQQIGETEQSLAILREQSRRRPDDPLINLLFAQTLLRGAPDDTVLAEVGEVLLRAVAAAPRHAPVRTELGKLYLRTGEVAKAVDELQKAVALDPADRIATYNLLVALRRAGRQAEAQALVVRVRALLDEEKAAEIARNRFRLVKAEPEAGRK